MHIHYHPKDSHDCAPLAWPALTSASLWSWAHGRGSEAQTKGDNEHLGSTSSHGYRLTAGHGREAGLCLEAVHTAHKARRVHVGDLSSLRVFSWPQLLWKNCLGLTSCLFWFRNAAKLV